VDKSELNEHSNISDLQWPGIGRFPILIEVASKVCVASFSG
jgi:hypothetical protein